MREAGILKGVERTGKGGYRWIYSPAMNEVEFKEFIVGTLIKKTHEGLP